MMYYTCFLHAKESLVVSTTDKAISKHFNLTTIIKKDIEASFSVPPNSMFEL
jgi:hypothetical protein